MPDTRRRYCRFCGEPDPRKWGKTEAGKQEWRCDSCHRQSVYTRFSPLPTFLDTDDYYGKVMRYLRGTGTKRLLITSAQNATAHHHGFLEAAKTYCRHRQAKLIIHPYRYHNPTSILSKEDREGNWYDDALVPYLLDKKIVLNRNLVYLGDVRIQPTALRPLNGLQTYTSDRSCVIGHPKQELVSIATPQNKLPKLLTSTGCITKKNYIPSKAGKIAEHTHAIGGVIIELKNGYFYLRHITADDDGTFTDLDHIYTGDGVKKAPPAAALTLGDLHYEFLAPNVKKAVYEGPESMMQLLKPHYIVYHDAWDGYAISHHHQPNPFIRYAKAKSGRNNVEKSLDTFFKFIDEVTPAFAENVFVASNHTEFLDRWMREADPKTDQTNALFWAKTYVALLEGTESVAAGACIPDAFSYWAQQKMKTFPRSYFLRRGQSFMIGKVEHGFHGDRGSGGSRGSINQFGKIGVRSTIGHSHGAGIRDGVVQVGLCAYLDMDYTHGALQNWLHAMCVQYASGHRSLLIVMPDASWRA